jgi:hypothetical protein
MDNFRDVDCASVAAVDAATGCRCDGAERDQWSCFTRRRWLFSESVGRG